MSIIISSGGGADGSGIVSLGSGSHLAWYPTSSTTVDDAADLIHSAGALQLKDSTGVGDAVLVVSSTNDVAGRIARVIVNSTSSDLSGGGGDAFITFIADQPSGSSTTTFAMGIDVSDDSSFHLHAVSPMSGTPIMRADRSNGQVSFGGVGSQSIPILVIGQDANTGIYAPASDQWAITVGGTQAILCTTSIPLKANGDSVCIATAKTPANASDTGTTGQICWDTNYLYVCVATNTWKRSAISTW